MRRIVKKASLQSNAIGRILYELLSRTQWSTPKDQLDLMWSIILPGADEMVRYGAEVVRYGRTGSGEEEFGPRSDPWYNPEPPPVKIGDSKITAPKDFKNVPYEDLKTFFREGAERFKLEIHGYNKHWEKFAEAMYSLTDLLQKAYTAAKKGQPKVLMELGKRIIIEMNFIDQLNHNGGPFLEHLAASEHKFRHNEKNEWRLQDKGLPEGYDYKFEKPKDILKIRDISQVPNAEDQLYLLTSEGLLTPGMIETELSSVLDDDTINMYSLTSNLPAPDPERAKENLKQVQIDKRVKLAIIRTLENVDRPIKRWIENIKGSVRSKDPDDRFWISKPWDLVDAVQGLGVPRQIYNEVVEQDRLPLPQAIELIKKIVSFRNQVANQYNLPSLNISIPDTSTQTEEQIPSESMQEPQQEIGDTGNYGKLDNWTIEQAAHAHWDDPDILKQIYNAIKGRNTPQSNLVEMSIEKRLQELEGGEPDYSPVEPVYNKVAKVQSCVDKYIQTIFPNVKLSML